MPKDNYSSHPPPLSAKNPHIFSLGEQKAFAFRALTRARALFMDQGFQI